MILFERDFRIVMVVQTGEPFPRDESPVGLQDAGANK
jgi:hypothetical protein